MVQRANIALLDGAATPVSHTFTPIGKPSGSDFEYFVERVSGVPTAQSELRVRLRSPQQGSASPFKVDVVLVLPETANVAGKTTIVSQNRVDITFTLSALSTTADRADALAYAKNFLANAMSQSLVRDLENLY